MNIVDIMIAKALTPQGQVETYAAKAQKAAQDALAAESSAETAIATVTAAAEDIAEAQSAAEMLLETAQSALETAQQTQLNMIDIEDVDTEIKKHTIAKNTTSNSSVVQNDLTVTFPDYTTSTISNVSKMYKSTGQNEDGTMTQKAISDLTAQLETRINNIPTGGGSSTNVNLNFGTNNRGRLVVVGENGTPIAGTIAEEDLIQVLIAMGEYHAKSAIGLTIDYDNKSISRTQGATSLSMGNDFNAYTMYGGRMRCNVSDNGTITAFYGDNNYREDGSNGQVMIYQPKFYYQRTPLAKTTTTEGHIVQQDSFMISSEAQVGFKLHPVFINESGEELDYILVSAYEGGVEDVSTNSIPNTTPQDIDFNNDKMTSVSGAKPITGTSGLSYTYAEQLAQNRGQGWHISNMQAESANQLLEIIEFGTLNGQQALGKGICNITSKSGINQSAITGATASLGNSSGTAAETTFEENGSFFTDGADGKTAISYRGLENPWGNIWKMLGGVFAYGPGAKDGGRPYISNNFTYDTDMTHYVSAGFSLPYQNSWISALGYGNENYDWVLMPAACSTAANSALPIGDSGWFEMYLNKANMIAVGGSWSFGDNNGPFYYACDMTPDNSSSRSYGARLMFIPQKNSTYLANITKWQAKIGG